MRELDAGKEPPDGCPACKCIAVFIAYHGRGFGRTVAFEDAGTSKCSKNRRFRLVADPFGAGEDVAHRIEVIGVRVFRPSRSRNVSVPKQIVESVS